MIRTRFRFRNNTRPQPKPDLRWMIFLPLRDHSYNHPHSFAMLLSQLAHRRFLKEDLTYDEYVEIQDAAYSQFPPGRTLIS